MTSSHFPNVFPSLHSFISVSYLNLSFSWSAALQMPLFELCRGKSELPLKEMGDLYIAELEKAGAAARGSYARKGKEGDHVAK